MTCLPLTRHTLPLVAFLFVGAMLPAQTTSSIATTIASEGASIGAMAISREAMISAPAVATSTPILPRVFAPTLPRTTYTKYPWKLDITATVFWVGELPTANNPVPNTKSSWDTEWAKNFGGYDNPDPAKRAPDYRPAGFVPRQNPFYIALPYNDCVNSAVTKSEAAKVIPWFKQAFKEQGESVCRDRWIALRSGNRTCYAQWSDCGPFVTTDASYVFGDARPANSKNSGAGIDVSPAVRDYLGFDNSARVDWRFVDVSEVPDGPWKMYGANNHFVQQISKDRDLVVSRIEELRRQRDDWFRQNGSSELRLR